MARGRICDFIWGCLLWLFHIHFIFYCRFLLGDFSNFPSKVINNLFNQRPQTPLPLSTLLTQWFCFAAKEKGCMGNLLLESRNVHKFVQRSSYFSIFVFSHNIFWLFFLYFYASMDGLLGAGKELVHYKNPFPRRSSIIFMELLKMWTFSSLPHVIANEALSLLSISFSLQ